jgi:hypothetical protein
MQARTREKEGGGGGNKDTVYLLAVAGLVLVVGSASTRTRRWGTDRSIGSITLHLHNHRLWPRRAGVRLHIDWVRPYNYLFSGQEAHWTRRDLCW